jgi:two-component system, NtrC family, C4-dicarboxylate transport response regulator DctD
MATTLIEATSAEFARKNLSICVLDDEQDQVDITVSRLERDGFTAIGTTNPEDAFHKIRLGGCRVVLCDFKMPTMDGLAFLEKTLQYDPGIHVLLMTGYYSV